MRVLGGVRLHQRALAGPVSAVSSTLVPKPSREVLARLARYTPRCLPAGQWDLAAAVVRAAVVSAGPVDAEDAKGLVSRLCMLLAGPCGWDRTGVPDLAGLLVRSGIDAHLDRMAAAGKKPKTRENHRADLARIARGLAGIAGRRSRATAAAPGTSELAAFLAGFPGSRGPWCRWRRHGRS